MQPTPFCSPLLFEELTNHLRRLGFSVGVDQHLRLELLLSRIYGQCSPEDLKSLICPLFAVSERQQEAFYAAFDSFLPLLSSQSQLPASSPPHEAAPTRRLTAAGLAFFGAAIILLSLLIGIAVWKSHLGSRPADSAGQIDTPTPPAPLSPSPQTADRPVARERSAAEVGTAGLPKANSTASQLQGAGGPSAKPSAFQKLQSWAARFPFDVATVLVIFGPILFFLAYESYRWSQRRLLLQKQAGRKPPHSWPIRAKGRGGSVYDSPQFSVAARRLHSRQPAESYHLDIQGTVRATTGALGYPFLQYRADSHLSEYLLLIDRASAHDHQATLFSQLVDALRSQGIYVQQYFFDGDPRICWSPEGNASVRLSDLQSRCGQHRVLLIGDAEGLMDPVTGRLQSWAHGFSAWADRVVLTPVPFSDWGARERALAGQFIVLPATTEALSSLIGCFGDSGLSESRSRAIHLASGWGQYTPPSEAVVRLKDSLDPGPFAWLCACAIYPELHWDLTLHLASLPCMPENLVTEANLLRLVALPWFRTGLIPDEIRQELIRHLNPEQEREVRRAIIDLLEQNPADEDTFAFETQSIEIAVNRDLLRRSKKLRNATGEARRKNVPVADHVVLRSLEAVQTSPLDFLLPRQLRDVFYERGLSVVGVRTAVRFALTAAVVLIGFGAVSTWRYLQLELHKSDLKLVAELSQLQDKSGIVEVTTFPVDAVISVKRKGVGVVQETTFPSARMLNASSRKESGTATQAVRVELPVGPIEIEARLPGYQPAVAKVNLTAADNPPITLKLTPILSLRLLVPSEGRAVINNEAPVTVQDGQFFRDLPVGHYSVKLYTGRNGMIAFTFEVRPRGPAVITGPPITQEVSALLISNFGNEARIYTGAPSVGVKLDGQLLGQLDRNGLELPALGPANYELELGAGKELRKHWIAIGPERTLTVVLDSDPNSGTLLVHTNQNVPITVLLNGKEVKHGNSENGTFRVANLKAGKYLVRATKDGYDADFNEIEAEVHKGEDTLVSFQFRNRSLVTSAGIIARLTAGSELFVDGNSHGTTQEDTRTVVDLEPGVHTFRAQKGKQFQASQKTVALVPGQTAELDLRLTTLPVPVEIKRGPQGSTVTYVRVGDPAVRTFVGTRQDLPEGDYKFTADADGYLQRVVSEHVSWDSVHPIDLMQISVPPPQSMTDWGKGVWVEKAGYAERSAAGFVLFPRPLSYVQFTIHSQAGKNHAQWLLNYVSDKNHVRCEISDDGFQAVRISEIRGPEVLVRKKSVVVSQWYTIRILARSDGATISLLKGVDWEVLGDVPATGLAATRFGFFVPEGQQLLMAGFSGRPFSSVAESTSVDSPTTVKSNGALRTLCSGLGSTFRKYPFQSSSTEDASLEEFAGIFHPETGAIWRFQQQSLADYVIKEGGRWKTKDPAKEPRVTQESLAFLNRAESIASVFYPGGATQPQLTYIVRPQLDPTLKGMALNLEIDGQLHQFTVFQKPLTWPSPPGTKNTGAVARLRSTTSNVGFAFASRPGIWGVFRIFGDAEPRPLNSKLVVWKYTSGDVGRPEPIMPASVQLEIVQFPGGQDVFNPKYWEGLRCPSIALQ